MRLCLRLLRSYLMMDHPLLLHWFTVNPSRRHPKLTGLPIGLSNRRMLNDPEAPEPNADMEKFEKYLRYFHKTVKKDLWQKHNTSNKIQTGPSHLRRQPSAGRHRT